MTGKLASAASKTSKASWNDVRVRPFALEDIEPQLDYIYRGSRENWFLQNLDFDRFPKEADYRRLLTDAVYQPENKPYLTIESRGQRVGVHSLFNIQGEGADFQAHIWNPQNAGKGIGVISWFKACAHFFEKLGFLNKIYFRVPKTNPLASGLAKKLPLNYVGSEDPQYPYLKAGLVAAIYTITREQFEGLSDTGTEQDVDDDEDESDL